MRSWEKKRADSSTSPDTRADLLLSMAVSGNHSRCSLAVAFTTRPCSDSDTSPMGTPPLACESLVAGENIDEEKGDAASNAAVGECHTDSTAEFTFSPVGGITNSNAVAHFGLADLNLN